MKREISPKVKGYLLGVLAAAAYGLNPVFAKPLYLEGMDVFSVLFYRYALSLPVIYILLRMRGRHIAIGIKRIAPICGLGALMAMSSVCLFWSYKFMDIGIASTLLFVYPLMVAVIMCIFYDEVLSVITFGGIVLSLVGIWFLCGSPSSGTLSSIGFSLVILSSLSYALYIVGISTKRIRNVATLTLTFWVLLSGTLILTFIVFFRGYLIFPHNLHMWSNVLLLALIPTVLSFVCTNAAIETIGSTATAVLGVFEPVTAVLFGLALFHESLSVGETFGLFLILGAVTMVIATGKISRHIISIRHMFPSMHRKRRHE